MVSVCARLQCICLWCWHCISSDLFFIWDDRYCVTGGRVFRGTSTMQAKVLQSTGQDAKLARNLLHWVATLSTYMKNELSIYIKVGVCV